MLIVCVHFQMRQISNTTAKQRRKKRRLGWFVGHGYGCCVVFIIVHVLEAQTQRARTLDITGRASTNTGNAPFQLEGSWPRRRLPSSLFLHHFIIVSKERGDVIIKRRAWKGRSLVPRCMRERILRPRDHGAAVGQIDRHDFITSVNPVVETSLLVHDGVNSCLISCPVMGNEIVA